MSDRIACACQSVSYSPVDHGGGLMAERWACSSCGSEFVRKAHMEYRVEVLRGDIIEKDAKIADLYATACSLAPQVLDAGPRSYLEHILDLARPVKNAQTGDVE